MTATVSEIVRVLGGASTLRVDVRTLRDLRAVRGSRGLRAGRPVG